MSGGVTYDVCNCLRHDGKSRLQYNKCKGIDNLKCALMLNDMSAKTIAQIVRWQAFVKLCYC